jgi:hypothetical protein
MKLIFQWLDEPNPQTARDVLFEWWCESNLLDRASDNEKLATYFEWRYGERGEGQTLLAIHGERCIAILDSFLRPYWINGRRIQVRETGDWFCLAEYRKWGVGLQLMRRMMAKPEPILIINGGPRTVELLPRLGWVRLNDTENFFLPITVRALAGTAAQRWWRAAAGLVTMLPNIAVQPRPITPPSPDLSVQVRRPGGKAEIVANAAYSCAPDPDHATLDWLARAPNIMGEFFTLQFCGQASLVGFSICRISTVSFGRKAQILHLHTTRHDLVEWILSETIQHLLRRSVGIIMCRTSCPFLCLALKRLNFLRRQPSQVYWWGADRAPLSDRPMNLSSLRGDDGVSFAI